MATRLEAMNASQHHSKVNVSIELGARTFVAGQDVTGRLSLETRADSGLGISVLQIELIAVQELTSRDHSATSTFLHSRRMFQGPGLPPSNAVEALPKPGDPVQLPQGYWPARRGTTTFLFRFPIPLNAPSSITFGSGLAKVTYRLKATVGVSWKHEKKLVTDLKDVEVVECGLPELAPEGTVAVGDNGKIWMQARLVGGVGVAGHPTCVELSVRNQTAKKAAGLSLTLIRRLHLPAAAMPSGKGAAFQLSDTLITVPFKGPEYQVAPGGEGVANLVFDIPRFARGVRGGQRQSAEGELSLAEGAPNDLTSGKLTDALFEVRCIVQIKLSLGIGSKDLLLDLPISIMHPAAIPEVVAPGPYPLEAPRAPFMGTDPYAYSGHSSPTMYSPAMHHSPGHPHGASPAMGYSPHMQPSPYATPPHPAMSPQPQWNPYFNPPPPGAPYYYPPPPEVWNGHPQQSPPYPAQFPPRPSSADPYSLPPMPVQWPPPGSQAFPPAPLPPSGLPRSAPGSVRPPLPQPPTAAGLPTQAAPPPAWVLGNAPPDAAPATSSAAHPPVAASAAVAAAVAGAPESEEGKGNRASRIAQNLHQSSRNRSASPTSRRFAHHRQSQTKPPRIAIPPPDPHPTHDLPVLSPRPILSPKRSHASIAVATPDGVGVGFKGTLRSDNVTALEQMAAKEEADKEREKANSLNLDGLPSSAAAAMDADKTLPSPPVPSGKPATVPSAIPRAADIFGVVSAPALAAALATPAADSTSKAETIRIGATLKVPTRSSGFIKPAGGLDALERRLLQDVGTTKVQARVAEAESESVLRSLRDHTVPEGAENELTVEELLALTGTKERALNRRRESTARPVPLPDTAALSAVRPHGSEAPLPLAVTASQERKIREQEDPRRKAEEKKREEEAAGLRNAAKGRVAGWLREVPPDAVTGIVRQDTIKDSEPTVRAHRRVSAEVGTRRLDVSKADLDALKDDGGLFSPQDGRLRRLSVSSAISTGEARKEVGTTDAFAGLVEPNPWDTAHRTRRVSLPPPTRDEPVVEFKNVAPTTPTRPTGIAHSRSHEAVTPTRNPLKAEESRPAVSPVAARANAFLESPPAKNYDIRSARGGRGGKVTSVAALWAAASSGDKESGPAKPLSSPKPNVTKAADTSPFGKRDVAASPTASPTPVADRPRMASLPPPTSPLRSPMRSPSPTSPLPRPLLGAKPPIATKPAPPPVAPKPTTLAGESRTSISAAPPSPLRPAVNTPATRVLKTTSVATSLSPSLAKPTLSTTASLARPPSFSAPGLRSPPSPRLAPTVSDLRAPDKPVLFKESGSAGSLQSASSTQEMQFGKARLKELIQKYQDGGRA